MEFVVDTIKHGFMLKFNNLPVDMYSTFNHRLSMDFVSARQIKTDNIDFHSMDRRLGFCSLPLVVLFLRVMSQVSSSLFSPLLCLFRGERATPGVDGTRPGVLGWFVGLFGGLWWAAGREGQRSL